MFKRILLGVLVVLIALNAFVIALVIGDRWGWWPRNPADREAARFRNVLDAVRRNHADPAAVDPRKLTSAALEEMVRSLDPHSEFLTARQFEKVRGDLRSEFGGIGVQIELKDDRVTVIAPIAGTPGERAGILRGDQIVKVDGQELQKPLVSDATDRLRGKPGTRVQVSIHRPATDETLELELTREIIKVETVRVASMLEPGLGYIQLTQFHERTADEFLAALEKLEAEGLQALIIDLRNNPGGLLSAAVAVVEPFFNRGELVVYTQGRSADSRDELRAHGSPRPRGYPIAVLVNSGSASAAEIVTGALRDTHRAVVVGERTFGKGSVQTLIRLDGGEALRLTTARYYTPSGRVINGKGIPADVEIPVSAEDDRKLAIQRARDDVKSAAEFKTRFGFEPIADRQLETAQAVLRGVLAFSTPAAGPDSRLAEARSR